jgi:DNA-binding MarR family transcriptional regulator
MDERSAWELLSAYVKAQQILFIAEQCLNLTKKSLTPLLKRHGLNHSQYLILMILRYASLSGTEVINTDLANLLGREKHSITPLIDALTRKGLVVRERSTKDRRAVFLRLTPRGRTLIETVQPSTYETVASIPVGTDSHFRRIYAFLESFRVRVARNSGQDPDLYRQAYERLLVSGEKLLLSQCVAQPGPEIERKP